MRTILLLAAATAPLLGCQEFREPIALPPAGAAVRHNMQAQIIYPAPAPGPVGTDAIRQQLAIERYRADIVEPPEAATTTDVVPE